MPPLACSCLVLGAFTLTLSQKDELTLEHEETLLIPELEDVRETFLK